MKGDARNLGPPNINSRVIIELIEGDARSLEYSLYDSCCGGAPRRPC